MLMEYNQMIVYIQKMILKIKDTKILIYYLRI